MDKLLQESKVRTHRRGGDVFSFQQFKALLTQEFRDDLENTDPHYLSYPESGVFQLDHAEKKPFIDEPSGVEIHLIFAALLHCILLPAGGIAQRPIYQTKLQTPSGVIIFKKSMNGRLGIVW